MEKNFFDFVNSDFFAPFSNENKRLNYDLLQLINNKLSLDNLQVEKEEIAGWIIDYVENHPTILYSENEDGSIESNNDPRTFAFAKIRYFIDRGWLIEDTEGTKRTYQMDEVGIRILETMDNVVKDDTKTLEFSGYVYNIYSLLNNFNFDHSVDIIERIYDSSKQLNSMLRGLNVNIKKFLTKLIKDNESTPKEILYTIFFEYQKKVVLKAFRNFREVDNPSKYKNRIFNLIDFLRIDENFDKMIQNYIDIKCDKVQTIENMIEAKDFYNGILDYVYDQFEEIEDYIAMLDRKNTNYISTARSRLNFLLNEETDVEGRIVSCLKGITDINDEFFEEGHFDLFVGGNLDEYSLYNPISKKAKIEASELIENVEIDDSEIEEYFKQMLKDNDFSVAKINEFVMENLGSNDSIKASDINISKFEDLLKVLLVAVFSENTEINYKIEQTDNTFSKLGYRIDDFMIRRRD